MRYTVDYPAGVPDIIVVTSGRASLDSFVACMREISREPRFRQARTILVDQAALDGSSLAVRDFQSLAVELARLGEKLSGRRVACVASDDLLFGMARAFEVFTADAAFVARAFRTREQAIAWLGEELMDAVWADS